jgi:hypothetical protein
MAAVLWMKRYGGHLLVGRLAKNLRLVMPAGAGDDEAAHDNKKPPRRSSAAAFLMRSS